MPRPYQLPLPLTPAHPPHATDEPLSAVERGSVFTRREVVEWILDLIGYTPDQDLIRYRLLEPAMGHGHFLLPAVERLLTAYRRTAPTSAQLLADLGPAVRAVEIDPASAAQTRHQLHTLLVSAGLPLLLIDQLLDRWLLVGDFLLSDLPHPFTHVIGNPPYVRHEVIPAERMARYRERYQTIYDRADLYVPFLERSLALLAPDGVLGVICADRWMKNKYGGPLRAMVAAEYHLAYYVDMVDTPAFLSPVSTYPAITVIRRAPAAETRVAHRPTLDPATLAALTQAFQAPTPAPESGVTVVPHVPQDDAPWILQDFELLALVRRLEAQFPTLEEVGCTVGIGVATGADRIYLGPYADLDVEPDRKLPLVKTSDVRDGQLCWQGHGVINPFRADGQLVDLDAYPRLAQYLAPHREHLLRRACVRRNGQDWYRTIDRIVPALTQQPKLLIPDIKGHAQLVYDAGTYYPHHNLYYITATTWDLPVLRQVLQSGIATLFVALYSTTLRGGYVRFQAQYLRRIRVPRWETLDPALRTQLVLATATENRAALQTAVAAIYGLTETEYQRIATYAAQKEGR